MTLNITRRAMAQMGYCPSGRLFEAAACGCPLLSDTWPGLETFFTPGEEILTANATEDAMNALQLSDAELKRIADAARERTLAEHTSAQRAIYLERVIEDALAGSKSPGLEVPACSDTESNVPGATAIREAGAEPSGGNRLHQTHDSDRGSVTRSILESIATLRLSEPRSEAKNVAPGSLARLQIQGAVPPHPGPLPEGEGTADGHPLKISAASPECSTGQSKECHSHAQRNSFLPLPKGEGRGEGEERVIQSSHVASPTNSAQAIGSREHQSQHSSRSILTSAATKQEFLNRHS
jgi:hypothetical protein